MKKLILVFAISVVTYLLFFHLLLNFNTVFWGSDMKHKFYPARVYLYKTITAEHRFPFWTERLFTGFPIYADTENAYLNPVNVTATVLLGPILSYKIIHFVSYLIGSLAFYLFLKRRGIGIFGYAAANVIFYFSYFFINHQIHQSLLMSFYVFPLSLLLIDKFLETRKFRYVFGNAALTAYAFYWGHPQAFLIYILGLFLYAAVTMGKFKTLLKYFVGMSWFIFLLILPQLLPSLVLNALSVRSSSHENISASQGSLSPPMVFSVFYPTIFHDLAHYEGEDVDAEYSIVETYIYAGIAATLLFIAALLFMQNSNLNTFSLILIVVFVILGFAKYVPFLNIDTVPVLSLFRYWNRSFFLALFGIAALAGSFVDKIRIGGFKFNKQGLLFFAGGFLCLIAFFIFNINDAQIRLVVSRYILKLSKDPYFTAWFQTFLLSIGLITLALVGTLDNRLKRVVQLLVLVLVFADLLYFSRHILAARTDDIKDLVKVHISDEFDSKRVVVEKGEIENNESLYYKNWWPYGYSQFVYKDLYDFFKTADIKKITRPGGQYEKLAPLGVTAVIYEKDIVYLREKTGLDLLKTAVRGVYTVKSEGRVELVLETEKSLLIETFLKYYPGWRLTVNGKRAKIYKSGLFMEFFLPAGVNTVVFRYVPIHFYYGVLLSFFGLTASLMTAKTKGRFSQFFITNE